MTRAEFTRGLAMLCEVYGEQASDLRTEVYFDALRDLPGERWLATVRLAIRTSRFFPRPAELREIARDLRPQPPLVRGLLEDHHRAPEGGPGRVNFRTQLERLRHRHGVKSAAG